MANKEQLDLLKQAHSALESESANSEWNRWREENPDVEIDLKNANLSNLVLRRINLSGASLENADLSYVWFMNSNFRGANLEPIPIGSTISGFQATPSQCERSGFKITGKSVHLSGSCVANQRCKEIWICQ
jgi:hypothetical protein